MALPENYFRRVALVDPVLLRLWGRLSALYQEACSGSYQVPRLSARLAPAFPSQNAHLHDVPTIVVCLEGMVRMTTARGNIDLSPGMALAIAPGAWHEHVPLRRGSAWYTQGLFRDTSDVGIVDHEDHGAFLTLPSEPSANLLQLLASPGSASVRRHALRDLLHQVLSCPGIHATTGYDTIASMHDTLWHGLGSPLRAGTVLAAAACSKRQAHRQFVRYFKETPKQVILQRKLVLARQALDEGASIAEAATVAGFRRRADLTRMWKKTFGAPPSEHRPPGTLTP